MSSAIYSTPSPRAGELKIMLLFGALFPVFFVAAATQRLLSRLQSQKLAAKSSTPSVIGEARDNMSIAMSYALMACAMLQSFARDNRAERLS